MIVFNYKNRIHMQVMIQFHPFSLLLIFFVSLLFSFFKTQRGLKTQQAPFLLDPQMFPLPKKRTTRNQVVNRPSVFIGLHCDPWFDMTMQLG